MTLSSTLNNALSGLNAASRSASVVASNLANVGTDGYGRRVIGLSSQVFHGSGGVRVDGISRHVDPAILNERRLAGSGQGQRQTLVDAYARLEGLVGTPLDPGGLSSAIAGLEAKLAAAASRPDLSERLQGVVHSAEHLTGTLNRISSGIQQMRTDADSEIGRAVDSLNTSLAQVEELNNLIVTATARGEDPHGLYDQRQKIIDTISDLVPLREVPRDRGRVALYAEGGAILLDGSAVELDFTPSNLVTADMTLQSGGLSGLSMKGRDVDATANGPLAGGRLAALFAVRDEVGVTAQAQVDGAARDLVERFQDATGDTTRGATDPALFTDAGAAFDPTNEVGLAGRISLNIAVNPDKGGALWRLRDGVGATAPGPVGDARLLNATADVMKELRVPASGGLGAGALSVSGVAAGLMSAIATDLQNGETLLSYANTRFNEMKELELNDGVDSDHELQRLMLIEQAYAANARVIETVDEMMQSILRI